MPYNGPYIITKVNENGTVQIRVESVKDTYNIRRIAPYIATVDSTHGGDCNMPKFKDKKEKKIRMTDRCCS